MICGMLETLQLEQDYSSRMHDKIERFNFSWHASKLDIIRWSSLGFTA